MNKKYMININNKTKLVDKTYPLAPLPVVGSHATVTMPAICI